MTDGKTSSVRLRKGLERGSASTGESFPYRHGGEVSQSNFSEPSNTHTLTQKSLWQQNTLPISAQIVCLFFNFPKNNSAAQGPT